MLDLFYNSVSKSVLALPSFRLITTDPKASRKVRTGHFESAPTCCILRHLPRIRLMAWEPKRGIVFTNCRVFRWFVTTLEIAASKGRNTASSVHSEVVRSVGTVTFKQSETVSKYTKDATYHIQPGDTGFVFYSTYWLMWQKFCCFSSVARHNFRGEDRFVLHHSYCHWRHAVPASAVDVKQTWNIHGPPLHTNPSQFHPPPILTTYIPTIHLNTLRTGSFKLFKRPLPGLLTILTL